MPSSGVSEDSDSVLIYIQSINKFFKKITSTKKKKKKPTRLKTIIYRQKTSKANMSKLSNMRLKSLQKYP
jgi:cell shape-determining protein MreC